jgi:large subunit ribosomal protein L32e
MTEHGATTPERALKLRARIKKRKPRFVRQESWKYVRLKENWRRPHGLDNKVRKKIKGWPMPVDPGYRGPKIARGLHPSGHEEVLVYNSDRLEEIDPKTQAIRIAHTVGRRKRVRILGEARRKKITVLNIKQTKEPVEKEEELKEVKKEEPEELRKEENEREEKKMELERPKEEEKATRRKKRTERQ